MFNTLPVDCPNCGELSVEIDAADLEGLHTGCTARCPKCNRDIVFAVLSVGEYKGRFLPPLPHTPLRVQEQIARYVAKRGYREPWTDQQFAIRNVAKLVEELGKLAAMVRMKESVPWPSEWQLALLDAAELARREFDDDQAWDEAHIQYVDAAKRELADLMVVVCNLADALGKLSDEPFDVMQAALQKSAADVSRGVRGDTDGPAPTA